MKKKYFKSIGLVVLGGILSAFIFSFSPKMLPSNQTTSISNPSEPKLSNKVCLEEAQHEIAAYQMWLKYLPKTVSFDTSNSKKVKINFHPREIDAEDWKILNGYIAPFLGNKPKDINSKEYSYCYFPFHSRLNTSYFISREDIRESFESLPNADGINVYIGIRGLKELNLDSMESHLFVVPTNKVYNEILKDSVLKDHLIDHNLVKNALDLTHPCPKLCDKDSELYYPPLKSRYESISISCLTKKD
ncbi:hypothetical protein [Kordia jejudonensis]|uniref:hypothetical protein n=1 Tax=Kordia jejudonensis TaxID=1348245 RepID=UPI0006295DA3|nr:hypothetical protein [Kordia jejudonensis]